MAAHAVPSPCWAHKQQPSNTLLSRPGQARQQQWIASHFQMSVIRRLRSPGVALHVRAGVSFKPDSSVCARAALLGLQRVSRGQARRGLSARDTAPETGYGRVGRTGAPHSPAKRRRQATKQSPWLLFKLPSSHGSTCMESQRECRDMLHWKCHAEALGWKKLQIIGGSAGRTMHLHDVRPVYAICWWCLNGTSAARALRLTELAQGQLAAVREVQYCR